MATFVSTTLARRTGATTTIFNPLGIDGGLGTLADTTLSSQRLSNNITMSSKRSGSNKRVTRIRVSVPLVDSSNPAVPVLVSTAFADITLTVPDGTPTANVNDLVGYCEKVCATACTNFNDLLVNGQGVW